MKCRRGDDAVASAKEIPRFATTSATCKRRDCGLSGRWIGGEGGEPAAGDGDCRVTIKKLQKTLPEVGRGASGPIPKFEAFAARSDTNVGIKGPLATL